VGRLAAPAAPHSHELLRARDGKGRLMPPIAVAEPDGALVTVFLPGSTGRLCGRRWTPVAGSP
jgi:hypothetical protein